jgi:peptidyl-prolyl cis-trans isomerase A (cyclophilin A)
MEAIAMRFRPTFAAFAATLLAGCMCVSLGCGGGSSPPAANIQSGDTNGANAGGRNDSPGVTEPVQLQAAEPSTSTPVPARQPQENRYPQVLIRTSLGDIRVQLNAERAPLTVDNFLSNYVDRDFYAGTVFHYVDKGFMIAGGGFTEKLEAKETRAYILNEADNGLKNVRGTIAMARLPEHPDSATSQFFINLVDNSFLDHENPDDPEKFGYCVFGKVVEGMNVVDAIAGVAVSDQGQFPKTPNTPVVIKSIERLP